MVARAYTPFNVSTRDRVVGFFVVGAVLLFLVGFLIPAVQRMAAEEGIPFHTVVDQTYGIAPEAIVSLRGVVVGSVTDVGMTSDGMVRVDIRLSPLYKNFYTKDSRMTIDTNISASTLLVGSGLILEPGSQDAGLMGRGEFIPTSAPGGVTTILETLDVAALTEQITQIISNVESVSAGLAENQESFYSSLDDLEQITANLADVTREIPGMVAEVKSSLKSLEKTTAGVDRIVNTTGDDLAKVLGNSIVMTEQATRTLAETEALFAASAPVMEQLPVLMTTTDSALQSVTELSDQMATSWLLGGSTDNSDPDSRPRSVSPHPYETGVVPPIGGNKPGPVQ